MATFMPVCAVGDLAPGTGKTVTVDGKELLAKSPTALKLAKQSFNADTEHIAGITELGFSALELYYQTPEALEGRNAFLEKRAPEFRKKRT